MKRLIDGHVHLEKGPLTVDYVLQFVECAVKKNISEIQILDHTHRFKEFEEVYEPLKIISEQKTWLENKERKFKDSIDEYLTLISEVKKLVLPIKVKFGLEVCYTKQTEAQLKEILKNYQFDFLIGAVHSVDNMLYDMSFSEDILWKMYDTNEIYEHYYDDLIACVNSNLFNQLAHPDTIKLFNYYPSIDMTNKYLELIDVLKKTETKAECNTGCYYRYNHCDLGLSDELLELFIQNDVKIITASDAHDPINVGNYIYEAQNRIDNLRKELCKC